MANPYETAQLCIATHSSLFVLYESQCRSFARRSLFSAWGPSINSNILTVTTGHAANVLLSTVVKVKES